MDVTRNVLRHAMKRFICKDSPVPNVAAVTWVDGSQKLLVVTEVVPVSVCRDMGKIYGYLIAVPDSKIVRTLSAADLRALWQPKLGRRIIADLNAWSE